MSSYLKCGLLGEKLGHSLSPSLHKNLGSYEYKLYEKSIDEALDFLRFGDYDVLNVTVPYKELAFSICDECSLLCQELKNTNIVVKDRVSRKLYGYNSDFEGFKCLLDDIDVAGTICIILGTGGASKTVECVLRYLGAAKVIHVSRNPSKDGEIGYQELPGIIPTANLIVNATPVGMFPRTTETPLELDLLEKCSSTKLLAVVDLIYNPKPTKLLTHATNLGFKAIDGLKMLERQAKLSSIFMNGSTSNRC
jgi:shikimate dehydrogenase